MGRLVAIAVLLTVSFGAWWLLRGEVRHAPATGVRAQAVAPAATADGAEIVASDLAEPATSARSDPRPDVAEHGPDAVPRETSDADAFRVRVLRADGTPMSNVHVSLESALEGVDERWRETTDADGRVRFSDLRARLASAPSAWQLRLHVPAQEPPMRVLDAAALLPDEFDCVLPPGGRLEVFVRELDGTPAPRGSEVRLRLEEQTSDGWKVASVDGTARFPWVELGREWELAAWRPQGTAPARARVHGPLLQGQTARVELVLGEDQPVVSFRAVDPSGRPFASVPLELAHRRSFGQVARVEVATDAQGRFLVDGAGSVFDTGAFVVSHHPEDGVLHQGRARLPEAPRIGWNDGGDVVLEPEPLLCAGVVLDPEGRGVEGADVAAGPDPSWMVDDVQVRGTSGPDGTFELRGVWDSVQFELRASKDHMRSETLHVRQGQEGIALALEPRHSISGTLGVDEGIDAQALQFQLEPREGKAFGVGRRSHGFGLAMGMRGLFTELAMSEPKHFTLEPVPAGVYSLRILLEQRELARTPSFALNEDLNLGRIDLHGRVFTCEIVLLGADDPGALRGKATWRADAAAPGHDLHFEGERVRIQTPTLPIDVALLVNGYRAVRLEGVAERAEVVLARAVPVRIVLETNGEVPAAPYAFSCNLRQDGLTVSEPRGARSFDPQDPVMAFECAAVGKVEVRWHLERSVDGAGFGGAIGGGVLDGHAVEIEVRDDPAEQDFTVPLDGALLERLMRSPPF